MFDWARLKYEMAKKGKSIGDMCAELHISRSAFYRKCKGVSEFTHSEIEAITSFLELDSPVSIFFAGKVS